MAHARFGPSKAHRVIDCPASLRQDEMHADTPNYHAAYGSVAHELAERILKTGGVASMFIGEVVEHDGYKIIVDEEMAEGVTRYVAWCSVIPGDHFIENRVDISRWTPVAEQFGTADFIAARPGHITVSDLKFGKGVQVFAEENPQAILYALGAIGEWNWLYDFKTVTVQIIQPRLDWIDTWDTTVEHLLNRGEYIRERFTLALQPDAPFGPSEKACKFCKAAPTCRALADHLNAQSALAFDVIDGEFETPDTNTLTVEELVHAWRVKKLYDHRMTEIQRHLMNRMIHGEKIPGLKTVEGKANRRWKNADEAMAFLTNDLALSTDLVAPRKMVSPSKVEKMMPPSARSSLDGLWIKPPGKPTLADERDKRPAYDVQSITAFDAIQDDEGDE